MTLRKVHLRQRQASDDRAEGRGAVSVCARTLREADDEEEDAEESEANDEGDDEGDDAEEGEVDDEGDDAEQNGEVQHHW